jgi:hypothetical protein
MEVLGIVRLLAEADVVIGREVRQQLIAGGGRGKRFYGKFTVLRLRAIGFA